MLRDKKIFRLSVSVTADHMVERRVAVLAAGRNPNAVSDHERIAVLNQRALLPIKRIAKDPNVAPIGQWNGIRGIGALPTRVQRESRHATAFVA